MSSFTVPTSPQPNRTALGRKLRFLLETHHLTVPRLAEILTIRRQTLQQMVDGKADAARHNLISIAKHFGVEADYFDDVKHDKSESAGSETRSGSTRSKKRAEPAESLTLKTLAVRYQGLVELLIEKGVFSAAEYNEHIRCVEDRSQ